MTTGALFFIDKIVENHGRIWLWLRCGTAYRNREIRFSVSYLFRIKLQDKYLLVKGNRINQFQPVGGAFKRYEESFPVLNKLGVLDDKHMPIDSVNAGDLRVRVKGRYVIPFIRWFESRQGREIDPWREFYEELVGPGIIDVKVFPYVSYRYIRTHQSPLRWSTHLQTYEILIAEVYELCPTTAQSVELVKIASPDTLWAVEDQIRKRGADLGNLEAIPISETSEWIL